MKTFSISEAVGKGWRLTTGNLGFLLGIVLVGIILPNIVQSILVGPINDGLMDSLITIAIMIVSLVVQLGIFKIGLMLVDGKKPQFNDLFGEYPKLINYVVASILFGLGVLLGTVLLVIPGIWFALRYGLYGYALVDKNLGPIEALKYSGQITQGNTLKLLGMWFAILGIMILGLIAFLLGILVAMPVAWLAIAYVYRTLSK